MRIFLENLQLIFFFLLIFSQLESFSFLTKSHRVSQSFCELYEIGGSCR